ncbi:MAG TPA: alpha/beta hydrolase-fold protein [Hyphomicrobiales bacterium]|nr:alpha/beta hydrolase-fold protein [Hyphomicrobiales bacterium]
MLAARIACTIIAFFAWQTGLAAASKVVSGSVRSITLEREIRFFIYLPDGYEKGSLHYPVLYLLHGAGGDESTWAERCHIKEKADQLIASGAIQPALIVMPGCTACWWVDGAKEKAETAFWQDFVPAIEMRYRTIEKRSGRLMAGLSAGGYGTVRFALRYPDKLAAIAALSPAVYTEGVPELSAARTQPPFLDANGKFDQDAWDRHNYPAYLFDYLNQPSRVPFYLVSGDGDKLGIAYETALLFKRIYDHQPELAELRVVDGDHSWKVWEAAIDDALRYIFRFADKPSGLARTAATAGLTGQGR